ncbi:hypothetical protein [Undibacterium sp. TC9W]|uniref:hypothetical protein n=1 Tax=Undibacterium sp. TC9W TaxID=3413053 RepID=UPI003BF35DE2
MLINISNLCWWRVSDGGGGVHLMLGSVPASDCCKPSSPEPGRDAGRNVLRRMCTLRTAKVICFET